MAELSQAVVRAHDEAVERGEDGYFDPETGLFVMTAAYLLARNRCCGSGCRHCPYDEETQRAAGRPR
ncbi:MAG: DUF5522 domain-containing protein [Myxococcota bacterium]